MALLILPFLNSESGAEPENFLGWATTFYNICLRII